jgi:hypothetical protein
LSREGTNELKNEQSQQETFAWTSFLSFGTPNKNLVKEQSMPDKIRLTEFSHGAG